MSCALHFVLVQIRLLTISKVLVSLLSISIIDIFTQVYNHNWFKLYSAAHIIITMKNASLNNLQKTTIQ